VDDCESLARFDSRASAHPALRLVTLSAQICCFLWLLPFYYLLGLQHDATLFFQSILGKLSNLARLHSFDLFSRPCFVLLLQCTSFGTSSTVQSARWSLPLCRTCSPRK
jgi:hypothetical protein